MFYRIKIVLKVTVSVIEKSFNRTVTYEIRELTKRTKVRKKDNLNIACL